jgi:protein-S-isoprenylcysteine O-methyltransferase Ste14
MVTGLDLSVQPASFDLPTLPSAAQIASNEPRVPGVDQWITIKSCGHPSRDSAEVLGLRLKDAILLAGVDGFGADFGTNKVRSSLSDTIKSNIKEQFGTVIRDEVHGIDIFEDGDVRHFTAEAHLTVQMDLPQFSKRVVDASKLPGLTPSSRTGAELINDSLFPMPEEARFILRISAIEALCEQARRPQSFQDLINKLLKQLSSLGAGSSDCETMRNVLHEARRQSVRQACLNKIRMRLGNNVARDFKRLYGLRSKYVHEGKGRGLLSAPAAEAFRIARDLLFAELGGVVVETNTAIVMKSSERKKVGMVLPPPIIFGLAAVGSGVAQYFLLGGFAVSEARSIIGGLVIVLSVVLIGTSARFFKKAGTPVRPVSPTTTIVQSGPYRLSRNPMYVGMAGILFGLSVCLGSPLFLIALVVALAIVHFGVVLPEEQYLKALHGDAYRRYKVSVRRWV